MELSGRSDMAGYKKIKGVPRKEALGMDEIIPMFIRSMKLSAGHNTQRVFAAWDAVSGVPAYSLRKFFRDGKLYVTLYFLHRELPILQLKKLRLKPLRL